MVNLEDLYFVVVGERNYHIAAQHIELLQNSVDFKHVVCFRALMVKVSQNPEITVAEVPRVFAIRQEYVSLVVAGSHDPATVRRRLVVT